MLASHRIGAPAAQRALAACARARRKDDVVGDLDHAAGVDDAHRDALLVGEKRDKPASARMVAKERA